jgi:type III pantothenate kinase
MNLCIDIGNTRIKFAIFDQENKMVALELANDWDITLLSGLLKQFPIQAAIISSVRDEDIALRTFLQKHLKTVLNLNSDTALPIHNQYQTPKTLGKDRIAAVVGALRLYPNRNLLVLDAGTCITYDFVDTHQNYWGGSILPGINMRLQSMHHFTAKLPLLEPTLPNNFVGDTTATAMLTGVFYGVLHELNGFRKQYSAKYGAIQVVITGGDSSYFESQLKNEIFAQPNLVLIGLNHILHYNSPEQK